MLISDAERARQAFYQELLGTSPNAQPELLHKAVETFERKIEIQTEQEIGVTFKKGLIVSITAIFIASVITMWWTINVIYTNEIDLLKSKVLSPSDRIIDSKVVSTLIGATVVQIAVAFGMVAKYLFVKQSSPNESKAASEGSSQ